MDESEGGEGLSSSTTIYLLTPQGATSDDYHPLGALGVLLPLLLLLRRHHVYRATGGHRADCGVRRLALSCRRSG